MTLPEIKQPLVSVIMPTYNHAQFIGEAIDSVLNQTYKNLELIVIDNYSEDNTEEIIRSFNDPRIKYMKFRNHGIIGASRNQGIRHAVGKYIAFLDSDDLWLDHKLERQLVEFKKGDSIGLVCTNLIYFDKYGEHGKLLNLPDKHFTFNELLRDNPIANSSVMIRRSVLDNVGLFDESRDIIAGEDYELWLRVAKKNKIRYIDTPLIKYRIHEAALRMIHLIGLKTFELRKRIYKNLLKKGIISYRLYLNLIIMLKINIIKTSVINFFLPYEFCRNLIKFIRRLRQSFYCYIKP